jgi:predicted dehydrogenase
MTRLATPRIDLPPIQAATEPGGNIPPLPLPPDRRVGFAIVGIGHLTLEAIAPAFAKTRAARITALVTGDRAKGLTLANALGLADDAVTGYDDFERLADRRDVDVVFIVLPNSQHCEFTERAAAIGKHVLCEKPMATSVAECERMIAACARAERLLMIAYRQQYEPNNRALVRMIRDGRFGPIKQILACNAQNERDSEQWRHRGALAGGGSLPDIGLYCLSAARFLSGEEPIEVQAQMHSTPGDPRFVEVEETMHFQLRFPSGLLAQCATSYGAHLSRFVRVNGPLGWAELSPAFSYHGLRLRGSRLVDGVETTFESNIEEADQFALEIDHMAACVLSGAQPHTGGAEGLQDQRIIDAIYRAAETGSTERLDVPAAPTRGPPPADSA